MSKQEQTNPSKDINCVTWVRYGRTQSESFDTAEQAYKFWLALPQGVIAKLYQHGKLVAKGDK